MVHSAIDNLLKGASGQAIHNMNISFGFPENAGLKLKSIAFSNKSKNERYFVKAFII